MGFEPMTFRTLGGCSTDWATRILMRARSFVLYMVRYTASVGSLDTKEKTFWCIAPSCIRFYAVSEVFSCYEWSCKLSVKVVFWCFMAFLFLFIRPRYIHCTNTSLLSKRRSISRVHTENCCLSRGFLFSKRALLVVILKRSRRCFHAESTAVFDPWNRRIMPVRSVCCAEFWYTAPIEKLGLRLDKLFGDCVVEHLPKWFLLSLATLVT